MEETNKTERRRYTTQEMNNLPQTLRTSLNTPNTPNNSNELNRVKHFEQLGLSHKLKEIDFNSVRYAWRGKRIEPIEPLELLRGLYESNAWNIWNGWNGLNRSGGYMSRDEQDEQNRQDEQHRRDEPRRAA